MTQAAADVSPRIAMNNTPENITSEIILLPGLCNDALWDPYSTWYTEDPQFGRCAERTVLLWAPCFLLWVCSPFYALVLKRRRYDPVPWSALAYTKVMVTGVVMAAAVVEGVWAGTGGYGSVTTADFLAPPILFVTYALYLSLLVGERRRGKRSSGLLWTYWLVAVTAGAPQLTTAVTTTSRQLPPLLVATFVVQYLGYVVLFVASSVNDVPSYLQRHAKTKNPSPEVDASFLNRFIFFYNIPLIWRGWRRPLVDHDLHDVLPKNSAETVYKAWRSSLDREEGRAWEGPKAPPVTVQTQAKVSVVRHILRQCYTIMLPPFILCLLLEAVSFLSPVLVGWLIGFMEDGEEPAWHGYLYAVLLFVVCQVRSLLKNSYLYGVLVTSVNVRTALMAAVYNKGNKHILYYRSLSLFVGPSALAGLAVIVILIPSSSRILSYTKTLQYNVMTLSDSRVKALSEIINGIKVLKLYAWEESFTERIKGIRDEELKLLKRLALCRSLSTFLFHSTPFLVSVWPFVYS
ncbi:Multidrug resistance-associated protein 1 [Chionoecetes opilio]|uniref:Multidrug resistance-associated protein 1 n=1 Tax=Chionoecetes opilio TaxID=41210 RepID=A0A8J4XKH4_CHIOP|nr:Multidrug resistance-associated protein 1 [Chionoecetes opilio]